MFSRLLPVKWKIVTHQDSSVVLGTFSVLYCFPSLKLMGKEHLGRVQVLGNVMRMPGRKIFHSELSECCAGKYINNSQLL